MKLQRLKILNTSTIIVAILLIGILGCSEKTSTPSNRNILCKVYPEADNFKKVSIKGEAVFFAYKNNQRIGAIVTASAQGYGGEIFLKVGIGINGLSKNRIHSFVVEKHSETPSYFRKVNKPGFINAFAGKTLEELPADEFDFKDKLGIDTVSGATISSLGILDALKKAIKIVQVLKL